MTRRRNQTDPQSQSANDPNQQLEGVHSVEESLCLLTSSINKIEEDLNSLYSNFQVGFCEEFDEKIFIRVRVSKS